MNHRLKTLATVALVFATASAFAQWQPNTGKPTIQVPSPASSAGPQRMATVAINIVKTVTNAIATSDIVISSGGLGNRIGTFSGPGYVRSRYCSLTGSHTDDNASYIAVQALNGPDASGTYLWQLIVNNRFPSQANMSCTFNGVAGIFNDNSFNNYANSKSSTAWVEGPPAQTWVPDQPATWMNGWVAVPGHYVTTRTMYQHTGTVQLDAVTGAYVTVSSTTPDTPLQAYDICIINPYVSNGIFSSGDPSCAPVQTAAPIG